MTSSSQDGHLNSSIRQGCQLILFTRSRGHSMETAAVFIIRSRQMARKITALKEQKRNPSRVNIFLDGEFAFSLARILAAWLEIGQELTEERIHELLDQDAIESAYQLGLRLIGYRMRTSTEIEKHLHKKGIPAQVIASVQERLKQSGLVNDDRFARNWIENRSEFRPRSHRLLTWELRQKGLDETLIQQAIAEATPEEDLAYRAGLKALRKYRQLEWEDFQRKITGFLARRGFSFEVIKPAVKRLWKERNE